MRTEQLEYFVAAVESMSFTAAAELCHVAQPAVSQQIHKLEEELGFALFLRTRNGLVLTGAGEVFYREAAETLRRLGLARERASQVARGSVGVLTVGACGPTQGSDMRRLERFHDECPGVKLRFAGLNTARQDEQLLQREFDVCYTDVGQLAGLEGVCFTLPERCNMCVMVNRANPFARRRSVSVDEVAAQTLIFAAPTQRCKSPSLFGEGPGQRIFTDTQENVQLMLRLDLGIAVAPDSVATSVSDDIVIVPTRGDWPTIELAWAYLASNRNAALRAFIGFIEHDMVFEQQE